MRDIAVAVGALIFCAVAPIPANAKTDHSTTKCEQKCHEYSCSGAKNLMYCSNACHKKCISDDSHEK